MADIIRCQGQLEIVGFLDDVNQERAGNSFCGSRILGGASRIPDLVQQGVCNIVIALGDSATRLHLASIALAAGFQLTTLTHPNAVIANTAAIGPGTVVAAGAVVNPDCVIGANVIVNTGATVDHECLVEDGAHIGPGTHIGGKSTISKNAWIGIGATVIDHIRVGASSVIGAGSVVIRDIPENVVAYGVPARVVRKVNE